MKVLKLARLMKLARMMADESKFTKIADFIEDFVLRTVGKDMSLQVFLIAMRLMKAFGKFSSRTHRRPDSQGGGWGGSKRRSTTFASEY
jgi:hypothetical protein